MTIRDFVESYKRHCEVEVDLTALEPIIDYRIWIERKDGRCYIHIEPPEEE